MFSKLKQTVRRPRSASKELSITGPVGLQQLKEGQLAEMIKSAKILPNDDDIKEDSSLDEKVEIEKKIQQLSDANDELFQNDVGSYLSLRILIETKLGRGSHLNNQEMLIFKENTNIIQESYSKFNSIVSECLKFKYLKESSDYQKQQLSRAASTYSSTAQSSNDQEFLRKTYPQQSFLNSDIDERMEDEDVNLQSIQEENVKELKQEIDINMKVTEALQLKSKIIKSIEQIQNTINQHRQKINPQAIINAQTEIGNLQRFFVRSKYKEMVKGCGAARSANCGIIQWAGTLDPGDSWMNDLLQSFLRHKLDSHPLDKFPPKNPLKSKSLDQNSIDKQSLISLALSQSESSFKEEECRQRLDLIQGKLHHPNTFKLVDIQELFDWIRSLNSLNGQYLHTDNSRIIIEDAVKKMGGWDNFETFCINWLRQFYVDYGRNNLFYPIPGCRPIQPEKYSTHSGSFNGTPISLSLEDLMNGMSLAQVSLSGEITSPTLQIMTKDQQEKYWNYKWKQSVRDLLMLHKSLKEENLHSCNEIQEWLNQVEASSILTDGKYKDFGEYEDPNYDDSLTKFQKKMLHPQLIQIREKAIVINVLTKPTFYHQMLIIERDIRTCSQSVPDKNVSLNDSLGQVSQSDDSMKNLGSLSKTPFKKGHKKAASTGVFESAGKIIGKFIKPEGENSPKLRTLPRPVRNKSADNRELPTTARKAISLTIGKLKEEDEQSVNRRSFSAPTTPQGKDLDPESFDFNEIRQMCDEILSFANLPEGDIIKKAFDASEVVVKYYLTEELPAKYQSVY